MQISVQVTKQELKEGGFDSADEIHEAILEDLNSNFNRDYPGFNIRIEIVDEVQY